MSTSKIAAVAAGGVVLAGAIAYLATREDAVSTPLPRSAADAPAAPDSTELPVAASSGSAAENERPYSANEELAKLEARSTRPGKDEFARRLSVKHEQLLKDLTKELVLNAEQAAALNEALDSRLSAFRTALDAGPQPGDSPDEVFSKEKEMLAKAGGIIRGAGLRDVMAGVLSDEQLAAFDEREAKDWQAQVDSHAYRELSEISPVLRLTEEQEDRTLELLRTSSSEKLKESADHRAFMALQQGESPAQLQLTDLAEAEFLAEVIDGPRPLTPDSPEFAQRIAELVGGQIQKTVELLAPVLDEQQKQRYREHLVQQSLLPQFGIELPNSSEP
jgi:hypothetical protein